jgi:hypothetical protein
MDDFHSEQTQNPTSTDMNEPSGAASRGGATPGENGINDGEGLEVMDPNDLFHRRDSDDRLQPVLQTVPGRDRALRVRPPTTGDYSKYKLDDTDALMEDDALLAELFNDKLVDLDPVTAEDVAQGMILFGAEPLVDCIKRAGGQDMKEALEQREMDRMMKMVGDNDMDFQKLVELGEAAENEEGNQTSQARR